MVEMGNVFYNLFSLVGHYYETALPPSPPCVLPSQPTVLPDETMQPSGNNNNTSYYHCMHAIISFYTIAGDIGVLVGVYFAGVITTLLIVVIVCIVMKSKSNNNNLNDYKFINQCTAWKSPRKKTRDLSLSVPRTPPAAVSLYDDVVNRGGVPVIDTNPVYCFNNETLVCSLAACLPVKK